MRKQSNVPPRALLLMASPDYPNYDLRVSVEQQKNVFLFFIKDQQLVRVMRNAVPVSAGGQKWEETTGVPQEMINCMHVALRQWQAQLTALLPALRPNVEREPVEEARVSEDELPL